MTSALRVERIEEQLGALVARHERTRSLAEFSVYRDNPIGFATDVLKLRPWSKQQEMLESYGLRDLGSSGRSSEAGGPVRLVDVGGSRNT